MWRHYCILELNWQKLNRNPKLLSQDGLALGLVFEYRVFRFYKCLITIDDVLSLFRLQTSVWKSRFKISDVCFCPDDEGLCFCPVLPFVSQSFFMRRLKYLTVAFELASRCLYSAVWRQNLVRRDKVWLEHI